jgi:hypothetical protein
MVAASTSAGARHLIRQIDTSDSDDAGPSGSGAGDERDPRSGESLVPPIPSAHDRRLAKVSSRRLCTEAMLKVLQQEVRKGKRRSVELSFVGDHLVLKEMLGRGGYGSVYRGTWHKRPAAIKVRAPRLGSLFGLQRPREGAPCDRRRAARRGSLRSPPGREKGLPAIAAGPREGAPCDRRRAARRGSLRSPPGREEGLPAIAAGPRGGAPCDRRRAARRGSLRSPPGREKGLPAIAAGPRGGAPCDRRRAASRRAPHRRRPATARALDRPARS